VRLRLAKDSRTDNIVGSQQWNGQFPVLGSAECDAAVGCHEETVGAGSGVMTCESAGFDGKVRF